MRQLEPLLSADGWAYASLPPQEPGDPGRFHALFGRDSLITALQVLSAAPQVARATLRALAPELYAVGPDGALQPVPVANRVQAWTVGARRALEHRWDGGAARPR